MTEFKTNRTSAIAAHLISDIFSPLLMPTFAMLVSMWLTRLHYLPLQARVWSTIGVFIITAIIPITFIAFLMKRGKVSDSSISDPRQRTLPYSMAVICFFIAAAYLLMLHAPAWLVAFPCGAAFYTIAALFITRFWKISAHAGGIGGLTAIILWLAWSHYIDFLPLLWLSLSIFITGLVCWARLYLSHHTLMQVFAGSVLAFVLVYATTWAAAVLFP